MRLLKTAGAKDKASLTGCKPTESLITRLFLFTIENNRKSCGELSHLKRKWFIGQMKISTFPCKMKMWFNGGESAQMWPGCKAAKMKSFFQTTILPILTSASEISTVTSTECMKIGEKCTVMNPEFQASMSSVENHACGVNSPINIPSNKKWHKGPASSEKDFGTSMSILILRSITSRQDWQPMPKDWETEGSRCGL